MKWSVLKARLVNECDALDLNTYASALAGVCARTVISYIGMPNSDLQRAGPVLHSRGVEDEDDALLEDYCLCARVR